MPNELRASTLLKKCGSILTENGTKGSQHPKKTFGMSFKKSGEITRKCVYAGSGCVEEWSVPKYRLLRLLELYSPCFALLTVFHFMFSSCFPLQSPHSNKEITGGSRLLHRAVCTGKLWNTG